MRKDELEAERQELIGLTQALDDEIPVVSGEEREALCRIQDRVDRRIDEITAAIGPLPPVVMELAGGETVQLYGSEEAFWAAIRSEKARSGE